MGLGGFQGLGFRGLGVCGFKWVLGGSGLRV